MEAAPILILVGIVALLGNLAGYTVRRSRLRKLRKADIQKPLYSIQDDLSPAEFGLIVDGTIGHKELVGEIILLAMQGQVTLAKLSTGRFAVHKNLEVVRASTPIQNAILATIDGPNNGWINLQPALEYETRRSLVNKDWIINAKPPLRAFSDVPRSYTRTALVIGATGMAAVTALTLIFGTANDLWLFIPLALGFEMVFAALAAMVIVFHGEMIHNAQFVLAATTKYTQKWKDTYGVYEYIRVSGMDVFTPDYETMDFSGLDPLYPYAVAAGLDKKMLKLVAV
jgi:hypothetical protein